MSRRSPREPAPGGARAVSRTGLVIPLDRFAIDPSLVYCLLHTYQLRPHLRVELGTRAATERAAALRLVDAAGVETHTSTGG